MGLPTCGAAVVSVTMIPARGREAWLSRASIAQNGGIEIGRLYEPPFTNIHPESVDGVFTLAGDVDDILAILGTFEPKAQTS